MDAFKGESVSPKAARSEHTPAARMTDPLQNGSFCRECLAHLRLLITV